MGWVGEYHWSHGPIVIASDALRRRWRASMSVGDAKKLAAAKKAFARLTLSEGSALVLPGGNHTTWIPLDRRSGYLVRRQKYLHPRYVEALFESLEPSWFEGPWKKVGTVTVDEDLHLFDVAATGLAQHGADPEDVSRCGDWFVLELDAGRYEIHRSRMTLAVEARDAEIEIFRVLRSGHDIPVVEGAPKPSKPVPLRIDDAVSEAAASLTFVGTDGGPLVLVHEDDLPRWYGVVDEDGEFVDDADGDADYWRACAGAGDAALVEGCRGVQVLALRDPIAHAFHRTRDGGIFVAWQGADTAAGLLGAVLAQSEDAWAYRDFTWRVRGPALLMDANRDGRDFDRERWPVIELEAGDYLVAVLFGDGAHEFDGEVRHPDGTVERVMVSAVRLRGPMTD